MNIKNWKKFRMSEIFVSFERGKVHSQNILPMGNDCFYVGAKKKQCGVMSRCGYDEELISKGNCMIFICNGEGSVGYCNYMDRNFMASGDLILAYGGFLNAYIAMFIETLLDLERPKYSFGRKYGKHVKNTFIPLPIDDNETPDWQWIENYVKETLIPKLPKKSRLVWQKQFDNKPLSHKKLELNTKEWQWFNVGDWFNVVAGKYHYQSEYSEGNTPYLSATATNNGIGNYIDLDAEFEQDAVTTEKVACTSFYQPFPFCATSDVNILRRKDNIPINKYVGLFLASIIDFNENYRWCYGRQCRVGDTKAIRLKLPAILNSQNEYEPDWQWMEDYIKSLPYSACL